MKPQTKRNWKENIMEDEKKKKKNDLRNHLDKRRNDILSPLWKLLLFFSFHFHYIRVYVLSATPETISLIEYVEAMIDFNSLDMKISVKITSTHRQRWLSSCVCYVIICLEGTNQQRQFIHEKESLETEVERNTKTGVERVRERNRIEILQEHGRHWSLPYMERGGWEEKQTEYKSERDWLKQKMRGKCVNWNNNKKDTQKKKRPSNISENGNDHVNLYKVQTAHHAIKATGIVPYIIK